MYGEGILKTVIKKQGRDKPFLMLEFENFKEQKEDELVARPYKNFNMSFGSNELLKSTRDEIEEYQDKVLAISFKESKPYDYDGQMTTSRWINSFPERLNLEEKIEMTPASKITAAPTEEKKSNTEELETSKAIREKEKEDLNESFKTHLLESLLEATEIVQDYERDIKSKLKDSQEYYSLVEAVFEKVASPRYYFLGDKK